MIMSKKFKIEYFKPNIVKASDSYYKNAVISFKEKNPLKLLLADNAISSADSIYEELYTKYEDEILKYSRPTDILKMTYTWKKAQDCNIQCVINCNSEAQYNYIKKIIPNDYPVLLKDYDATDYDEIIVRDVYDLDNYRNLKQPHLCIYLLNLGINYSDNGKIRDEAYSYFPALPKTIDMYTGFSYCLPPIEEEKINE